MKGFIERRNRNGFYAVRLHYSADPLKDPETAEGTKWVIESKKGCSDNDWQQEMEINPNIFTGTPVFPVFDYAIHTKEKIKLNYDYPVIFGYDFGYHFPAMVAMQWTGHELNILYEWVPKDIDNWEFGHGAHKRIAMFESWGVTVKNFTGHEANRIHEDSRSTTKEIFQRIGIELNIVENPDVIRRVAKIRNLIRLRDGRPSLYIDRSCTEITGGFQGGYRYAERKGTAEDKPADERPHKDGYYDNIFDAFGYGVDGNFELDGTYIYSEMEEQLMASELIIPNPYNPKRLIDLYGVTGGVTGRRKIQCSRTGY